MDIILIPGLWLDGSSWEKVVPVLEQAGHRTHALTLPGMESKHADRSKITRRDRVARVVYVGGFPLAEGEGDPGGYPAGNGEVPLPDWSAFEDADLADLDDKGRVEFRERAIPSPERVTRDPQQLSDERRYDVPITVICTEFTSQMLREWIERGLAPVRELPKIRDVEYVDLATGHWPQFTRPEELGRVILASIDRGTR